MQSGFYMSGVAGQMAQSQLNDINHNLANVNTIGYMASRSSFSSTMAGQSGEGSSSYPALASSFVDMKPGQFKQTGNTLDFAIQGDAFFRVRLEDGQEAYTRAGNFSLDANGNLLTQGGQSVLDQGGSAIKLPAGQVSVGQDGFLAVDNNQVAQFGMVSINNASGLSRIGNALLATSKENTAPAGEDVIVRQGIVEGSNVNSILAMTEMVVTTRNFEATMKTIEQYNQQASQLYDQVGLIRG